MSNIRRPRTGKSNFKPARKDENLNHSKLKTEQAKVPNGLPNLGNTCYLNSTLQCLYWCPGFHYLLVENKNKIGAVGERLLKVFNGCLSANQYQNRQTNFYCGLNDNAQYVREKIKKLLNRIRERNDQFAGFNQQDSFEVLNTILSSIHDDYKQHGKDPSSPVDKIFGGMYVTSFVHSQCKRVDVVFQNFTNISVPVKESKTYSTHSFVQRQPKSELQTSSVKTIHVGSSSGDNMIETRLLCYTTGKSGQSGLERGLQEVANDEDMEANILLCRKCHENSTGVICKKSNIFTIPKVLVLHISRFSQSGRSLYKNQSTVTYPEVLSISDVCSAAVEICNTNEKDMKFELCGIVEHRGTMDSGHYVAYVNTSCSKSVRHSALHPKERKTEIETFLSNKMQKKVQQMHKDSQWYRISDSDVTAISSETALNLKDAYILFYTCIH